MAVECKKHELDLFSPKLVQYSVLKVDTVALKPIATLENATSFQFISQPFGEDYKNLESIYLVMKVKMIHKKLSGEDIKITDLKTTDDLVVAPVNNTLHSLFRQIILTLNNKQIGQNTQNYAYR